MSYTIRRRLALTIWDISSWLLAGLGAAAARYEFAFIGNSWNQLLGYLLISAILLLAVSVPFHIHDGRFRVGSFDEAIGLGIISFLVGIAAIFATLVIPGMVGFSRGVTVITPVFAFGLILSGRLIWRLYRYRGNGSKKRTKQALIYGAGEAGAQLTRLIFADQNSKFNVVGYIDDDPHKRHLRIFNLPVLGTRDDLEKIVSKHAVDTIILAITTANGEFLGGLQDQARKLGLDFRTLPPLAQMIDGRVTLGDVKRVGIHDILGRHQVQTDLTSVAEYITGKRILITGAGGSIGSEIAAQVHRLGPAEMSMLDRDESALHSTQLAIFGRGLLDTPDVVLCDIRDKEAMRKIFQERKPEVVFHAAALKHLPMLEQYPDEGWKTNVLGTLNVLELSEEFDVEVVVNISTDKAADPTSVLGHTKRIAEQLTAWHAQENGKNWMSVRFGNVLGSRGSMLHAFNAMIDRGGPLTVTHPDITRYFMTISEACQLVIQSGALGRGGEVMVLEMGVPVKILDVANRMIAESGKKIEIQITGLRPGEKMHEVLFNESEVGTKRDHPMISHVPVPPLDPSDLEGLSPHPEVERSFS